jgi:hypothetical protein
MHLLKWLEGEPTGKLQIIHPCSVATLMDYSVATLYISLKAGNT